jgi:hypothetical protein
MRPPRAEQSTAEVSSYSRNPGAPVRSHHQAAAPGPRAHSYAAACQRAPHRLRLQLVQAAPGVPRLIQLQREAPPGALLARVAEAAQAH